MTREVEKLRGYLAACTRARCLACAAIRDRLRLLGELPPVTESGAMLRAVPGADL